MTPKERAAMQQAIEFIVDCEYGKAELALREALAEQACPNGCDTSNGRCVDCPDYVAEQAEQEPVGYLCEASFGRGQVFWFNKPADNAPLYTAPVRTKDLTDDEIFKLFYSDGKEPIDHYKFARAVIAKFKEKNK